LMAGLLFLEVFTVPFLSQNILTYQLT
jgi:hypothetical protein